MGHRDRSPHPRARLRAGDPIDQPRRYEVVLSGEAEDELVELISYINKDSPKNAAAVLRAILRRRDLLAVRPRIGHADPNAPLVPAGSRALLTTVKGIGIYYLFPLEHRGRDMLYVVSLRRGSRMPLSEPDYARRWIEAASQLPRRRRDEHDEPARDPTRG